MNFEEEVSFDSNLHISDIKKKLIKITHKTKFKNDHLGVKNFYDVITNEYIKIYNFEGNINDDNFKIFPLFDYGLNLILRPKITGIMKRKSDGTSIYLKFTLPYSMKIFLIVAVAINLLIITFGFIKSNNEELNSWDNHLIFLLITYFFLHIFFNFKVKKSKEILIKVLNKK